MKKFVITITTLLPLAAAAQDLLSVINTIGAIIAILTPIAVAAALLFFFWGLALFILAAGDESARERGRSIMIWGIIALFIVVSVWGLVQVLQRTFLGGTNPQQTVPVPAVLVPVGP